MEELFGRQFGRLIILGEAGKGSAGQKRVECRCKCGNVKVVQLSNLKSGHTRSCGCLGRELRWTTISTENRLDYESTPEYAAWHQMLHRCLNPRDKGYRYYGGRGITVYPAWANSFKQFLEDLGRKPSLEHSLDQIDNDRGYEPGNCRWATRKEQMRNRRMCRLITVDGETRTLAEWAELTGIKPRTIAYRLDAGWGPEQALATPVRSYVQGYLE